MKVLLAQLKIEKNISINEYKIIEVLDKAKPNQFVIFPEGMLSGYYPEDTNFLNKINIDEISKGINKIWDKVKEKNCYCIFGTVTKKEESFYNSSVLLTKDK